MRCCMADTVRYDKYCDIAVYGRLSGVSLESEIATGGTVYSDPLSHIQLYCIANFIYGNKGKEFSLIWYQCHLFINKLCSDRFDSESAFWNNSLHMGSSFSCVGIFVCNSDKETT